MIYKLHIGDVMIMIKRCISILVTMCVMVAAVFSLNLAVSATESKGKITLTYNLNANAMLDSYQCSLMYNSEQLEFDSAEEYTSGGTQVHNNKVRPSGSGVYFNGINVNSFYDFTSKKDFISVTFNVIGELSEMPKLNVNVLETKDGVTLNSSEYTIERKLLFDTSYENYIANKSLSFQGASIHLVEPWQMVFAYKITDSFVTLADEYGVVVIKEDYYNTGMTGKDIYSSKNASVLSSNDGLSTISNNYIYATYDKNLYCYQMDTDYYCCGYAVIDGKMYFENTVNCRNYLERIQQLKENTSNPLQKPVFNDMFNMYNADVAYLASKGYTPKTASAVDENRATVRGANSAENPYTVVSDKSSDISESNAIFIGTSIHLLEPWGMAFGVKLSNIDLNSADEYGMVYIAKEDIGDKTLSGLEMLKNENSYVYSSKVDSGKFITPTVSGNIVSAKQIEGIYTYQMDKYFVGRFYYVKDGVYHFSNSFTNNAITRVEELKDNATDEFAKELYGVMYTMYNDVKTLNGNEG